MNKNLEKNNLVDRRTMMMMIVAGQQVLIWIDVKRNFLPFYLHSWLHQRYYLGA
jgi:hypothetical protein